MIGSIALLMTLCGVRFETPPGWTAMQTRDRSSLHACTVGLKPLRWDRTRAESDDYLEQFPILLLVSNRPTEEVARIAGFERVGAHWLIWGKAASKADPIKGRSWTGLFGEAVDRNGVEVRALLIERSARHRTASAECVVHQPTVNCSAVFGLDTDFAVVLKSIEFVGKR